MNVMMLLEMAASGLGDRVAVGSLENGITYQQLFEQAGEAAARFRADPGAKVVLCDESSPAVPVALFGAAWAGMPYVPLNYRLPDDDLRGLAERSTPGVAIGDDAGASRLRTVGGLTAVTRDTFLADHPAEYQGTHSMPTHGRREAAALSCVEAAPSAALNLIATPHTRPRRLDLDLRCRSRNS